MRFIKRNIPIFITGLVLLIIFLFVIIASQTKPSTVPTLKTIDEADLIAAHTYILGFTEAPLSLVVFSNYRNSMELAYMDVIYEIYKENPRYLSVALRPLPNTKDGELVSQASQIAGDQGKYWEYAVISLENADAAVNEENLTAWAKNLGLNIKEFQKDLENGDFKKLVESDMEDAEKLEITTTPTFFLNKQRLSVEDAQDLKELLEAEIARIKKAEKLEIPQKGEETTEVPEEKELTLEQEKRIETLMEINYTEAGWDPSEAQPFKGQPVRWKNTTNKTIYLQPLDKSFEGLTGIVQIKPGEFFEYKFPSGGIFYYQEMATFHWGMVIIDW